MLIALTPWRGWAADPSPSACAGSKDRGHANCATPSVALKDCDVCPELVLIPSGTFVMGSPQGEAERSAEEGPEHRVTLKYDLAVGRYEVTFAEWDACVADGGCTHMPRDAGWGRGRHPVINIAWNDVVEQYLPWLSKKTGHAYRLLTEAEWEYCARAGTASAFSTGVSIGTDAANFDGTSTYQGSPKGLYRQRTLEVGSFPPNGFGLYDMHGNVREWVQDCFVDSYTNAPADGSAVPSTEACARVVRGGAWIDSPRALRSAYRSYAPPDSRFIYRGFRVARPGTSPR